MIIGKVSRYIAGRSAVQTVYWRTAKNGNPKLVKTGRILNIGSRNPQETVVPRDNLDAVMKYLEKANA